MERCHLTHGRGQPLGPVGIQSLSPIGTEDTPGDKDIGLQNFVWYPPANHPPFRSQVRSFWMHQSIGCHIMITARK